MKKVLLMSLAMFLGVNAYAQEEDVTHLIKNAGFDSGLTFTDEGQPVNETTATGATTGRSRFVKSTDGSIYAVQTDGKGSNIIGAPSWYGFLGNIEGWEVPAEYATETPEWKYFGALPYSLKTDYLAIGDGHPAGAINAPESKPEGNDTDDNTGFLYLRAGWGGACAYKQVVNLPCAQYRLEYWTINTNANSTAEATNLSEVVCRKDVFKDTEGLSSTTWTKHEIEFTPVDEFSIQFGYKSAGSNSNSNPWLIIDGIKLYKIGEATEEEIIASDLSSLEAEMYELMESAGEYGGLTEEINDAVIEIDDCIASGDLATMKAGYEKYNALKEQIAAVVESLPATIAFYNKAEEALALDYPGASALQEVLAKWDDVINSGYSAAIAAYAEELNQAYRNYMFSQVASEASPADYTFLIANPLFVTAGNEPTIDGSTFTYPNQDTYTPGSAPADATSEGWYKAGTYTDGDQRLNYAQNRICWNAWGNNADGKTLAVATDLENLPNGYYKVAGDLITQAGFVTDQHVFGTSALQSANSAPLTDGLWSDDGYGTWTTLTTEKVLVHDGKLTIGASGTMANANQSGWFCATNFKLYFVGKATDQEIADALAAKVAHAQELAAAMHFAADKAQVLDSISAYTASGDVAVLNGGIALAETSEAKYEEVNAEGKTIPTVAQGLADNTYGEATEIVKYAYDAVQAYFASAEATYTEVDAIIAQLKAYVNNYAPVYNSAYETYTTLTSSSAKAALEATFANHKALLTAKLETEATVASAVSELTAAVATAQAQENYENNPDASDYTAFIINAQSASTDGWTVVKGDGDGPVKSGQYFTGDASRTYFDTWNGTAGKNNFYMEQVIEGLPNGTYTLGANVRTSGLGACLFGAVGTEAADTTWMEIPLQTYTYQDPSSGDDVTENATDKWGQIWLDAQKELENDKQNAYLASITGANVGNGYGWMHLDIPNIEVVDHTLTIGLTSDSTKTGKPTTVTWYSATDFTLTLTKLGNNEGWNGPITGITEIKNEALKADAIYNINGQRVANTGSKGLYIVVRNGKAVKVATK